jgi:hypothetical protein
MGFLSLLGHSKYKCLKLFQDTSQEGMDTMLVKVKVPCNTLEGPEGGGRGIAALFLDLSGRRGWVVSTMPRPFYPQERPGTYCTGGWVGPQGQSGCVQKISPPPGFDPQTVQSIASHYTD